MRAAASVERDSADTCGVRREARREPRRGKRVALAAVAELPQPLGRVLVYSLHLEVFTGITGRLMQFAGASTRQLCCL